MSVKRKHAGKSQSSGKKGLESGGKQKPKPKEDAPSLCKKLPLVLVVLSALAVAVYLTLPTDYSGKHASKEEEPKSKKAWEAESTSEKEWELSGVSCSRLMAEAKAILEKKPERDWDYALDLLATCALQEPENSAPRWNLAVALLQMNRVEEALQFVDEALSLDPSNADYLKTGGGLLSQMGHHVEATRCLERYLELSLRVPSWEQLLASISVQREDEWSFLYDAGKDVVQVFELLLHSYLNSKSLIKAGYLYKVIIGLKGADVNMDLLAAYSFFSFGLGDIITGVKYLRMYTEHQYILQGYGNGDQAYEVVTAHSLRLFSAGLDAHIVSIAKNLLMAGEVVWEELEYNCELTEDSRIVYSPSVRQSDLKNIFVWCLLVQNIITSLLEEGAVIYAENIFGWTPLLHTATLGSVEILRQLIGHHADPQARTVLAHTSLHVAAMRGSYEIVLPLIQAGLRASDVDYFNRTALQVACLQRWTAGGMAEALSTRLPHNCLSEVKYLPPVKHSFHGGWLGSGIILPQELTREQCDFDVLASSDVDSFLYDYLALQRPVIIRNATNSHELKTLFHTWQRNRFEQEFGRLELKEVTVPYVELLGHKENSTTIKTFMKKMKEIHSEHKELGRVESVAPPTYIYETVPSNSPLLKKFKLPHILDPSLTYISMAKTYFYLGTTFTGAAPHFHRSAWNLLVYGQKRWFLYPPDRASYSKQPVLDWWRENYRGDPSALECMQHSGDLVFIPDMWGHAVINVRESIGLAAEFIYGNSEFSI